MPPGYPWSVGDALLAADLNAAIAGAGGGGGGGSFLPLTGGTIAPGPLTLGNGTGAPALIINGAVSSGEGIVFRDAGTPRFNLQTTTVGDRGLSLYGYDTTGAYAGEILHADTATKVLRTEYKLNSNVTTAPVETTGPSLGLLVSVHNTGVNQAFAALIQYTSTATGPFDTALGITSTANAASPTTSAECLWFVQESPNDPTVVFGGNVGEMNYVNRGPDVGFKRDRGLPGNNTGGLLFVPESVVVSGGPGEGKNVGYGFSVAHSSNNNSSGFQTKTYIAFNSEPNAVAGLTGRAFYASGDITGVASQYPYGPFQIEGTWLHGIDHTLATYQDGMAQVMAFGQTIGWIEGPTTAPTSIATIGAIQSGGVVSLELLSAGGLVFIGNGAGTQKLLLNGASGQNNGIDWRNGGFTRWEMVTDASNNLYTYAFDSGGGYLGQIVGFLQGPLKAEFVAPLHALGGFSAFTFPPVTTKPTVTGAKGGNVALASLLTALVNYGLITDTTTA